MTHQNKATFISFRRFLVLVTVAVILVISATSVAANGDGTTPDSAFSLADQVNAGFLNPGEQHWFRFMPDKQGWPVDVEQSFDLVFVRDDGFIIRYVSLKLFAENQIQFFDPDDGSTMTNFGEALITSRDDDPETGELTWIGSLFGPKTYYVQVQNHSDFPIAYQLFNTVLNVTSIVEPESITAYVPPKIGTTPGNPAILKPDLTQGRLEPHSTYWYSFRYIDFIHKREFQDLDFSMFFTPDDGNRRHYVNFNLFSYNEFKTWQLGNEAGMANFGAGMLVSRDNDYNTGERIWRGTVAMGDTYLMSIENGTDVEIDYWIFDSDIYTPELGSKSEPASEPVFAQGVAPQSAFPLDFGLSKDGLNSGEENWYNFRLTDFDDEEFEKMTLTMVATPDDGNRIRNMTFDLFTASGVRNWSPNSNNFWINNFGAGSVVYRDDNPLTGERVWQGWVIDNELYYVQIRNSTGVYMDYWLFTDDIYKSELGEKTQSSLSTAVEPGTTPASPIPLKAGVVEGSLHPHQERWYTLSRADTKQIGQVETVFTMFFTPDDGNRIRDVNFELFESYQLRDWSPDNRFNLVNFGQGSVVSRDGGLETGELLWKGHILAQDVYYMRVSNESKVTIEYQIFPQDVTSTVGRK